MIAREPTDEATLRQIGSPCIGICAINPDTNCCRGCFRTLAEVATWSTSSAAQRIRILDRIESRGAISPAR
jgi:hypothetical protein